MSSVLQADHLVVKNQSCATLLQWREHPKLLRTRAQPQSPHADSGDSRRDGTITINLNGELYD